MKRQSSIDVIKFFLAIVILLYHFDLYFLGGYLAVEGFFMISGYLMMRSLYKKSGEAACAPDGTARFVLHKYAAIFFPLLFSAISGFLIYECLIYDHSLELMLEKAPLLLYEIFPLQVAGFGAYYSTGVSWYLSSLFLSIALLHPFAKKDPARFSYTVCPLIILLGYGYLCAHTGKLDVPASWLIGLFNSGLIRGAAGVSAGCLLFTLTSRAQEKSAPTMPMRVLLTVLEIFGWAFIIKCMSEEKFVRTPMDYVAVAVIFGVLYIALSQRSLFSLFICHKWTAILSTCSTYMFMNHYAWNQYFKNIHPEKTLKETLPWYLLCVAASSLAVWVLTKLTEKTIRFAKVRSQKAMAAVQTENNE